MAGTYQCLQRVLNWNILLHLPKLDINATTLSRQYHAVFHYFLSDDRKQDAATNTAHRKRLISLLKEKKLLTKSLSKIW